MRNPDMPRPSFEGDFQPEVHENVDRCMYSEHQIDRGSGQIRSVEELNVDDEFELVSTPSNPYDAPQEQVVQLYKVVELNARISPVARAPISTDRAMIAALLNSDSSVIYFADLYYTDIALRPYDNGLGWNANNYLRRREQPQE